MVFPTNNLPTQSRFWGREVEKKIVNLENSLRSSDINNTTRDSQLQVTATQAVVAANLAQDAAQGAADAAAAAGAAAITANTAATTANNAITGLGSLDEPTSTYKINASNVTVGSLSGDRISGGEIIGTTLKTASSGPRLELLQNDMNFYDDNGNYSGSIIGDGVDRASTLELTWGNVSGVYIYNGGLELYANGVVGVNAQGLEVFGGGVSSSSVSTGGVSCSSVSSTGSISGTTVSSTNFSGTVNTSIANNTQTSFSGNLFINSSGNMFRNPTISSREAKEDIAPYTFDTEAFIAVEPVTFKYKDGVIANPDEAGMDHLGFILEDFEEAGVAEHLTIPANEIDVYKGLRYDKLYMMLHKVVQEQNTTIKELTARIEALESR